MYYKFLPALSVFLEVNRPLWSTSSDSFCSKSLCVGWLAGNLAGLIGGDHIGRYNPSTMLRTGVRIAYFVAGPKQYERGKS